MKNHKQIDYRIERKKIIARVGSDKTGYWEIVK